MTSERRSARQQRLLERFVRYVSIDTQSDPHSSSSPSTAKQLNLLNLLVDELREIGCADVAKNEFGVVTATIPSTLPAGDPRAARVPTIGFLAHVDTSPDITAENVRPEV